MTFLVYKDSTRRLYHLYKEEIKGSFCESLKHTEKTFITNKPEEIYSSELCKSCVSSILKYQEKEQRKLRALQRPVKIKEPKLPKNIPIDLGNGTFLFGITGPETIPYSDIFPFEI